MVSKNPTSKVSQQRFYSFITSHKTIGVFFLCAITIAAYHSSLNNLFLVNWDDYKYVVKNPDIRGFSLDHIRTVFSKYYVGNYAPLQIISYMLDYTFWGMNPAGFIGFNVALHLMNGMLFFLVVDRISANCRLAFLSALGFLLHPVQVESVVWISQRKTVLAMFFFLVALLSYVCYRENRTRHGYAYYIVSLLAFLCALLSKSVTVILPLVLVLYDLCIVSPENRRKLLLNKIPFGAAAVAIAALALKSQAYEAGGGIVPDYLGDTPFSTFFTMLTVFMKYAGLLIWPSDLSIIYNPPIRTNIDWAVAMAGTFSVLFCFGLFYLYRRNKQVFFWASLAPIGLLPVSQMVPLTTIMNDRYLYFPLIGCAVVFAQGALYCTGMIPRLGEWRGVALVCLALSPLPVLTWQRTLVWHDSLTLWTDAYQKSQDYITAAGRGNALAQEGRFDEALEMYDKSLSMEPTCEEALRGVGAIYLNRGDYDRAIEYLQRYVSNYPESDLAKKMLGLAYSQRKKRQENISP